jgi:hypothetical protein
MSRRILLIEASTNLASCAERAAAQVSATLERAELDQAEASVRAIAPDVIAASNAVVGEDPGRLDALAAEAGAVLISIDDADLDHGELALLFQTSIDAAAERRAPSQEPEADPASQ